MAEEDLAAQVGAVALSTVHCPLSTAAGHCTALHCTALHCTALHP
jgi:hypothetical protein